MGQSNRAKSLIRDTDRLTEIGADSWKAGSPTPTAKVDDLGPAGEPSPLV
jgi:hypothetical protein